MSNSPKRTIVKIRALSVAMLFLGLVSIVFTHPTLIAGQTVPSSSPIAPLPPRPPVPSPSPMCTQANCSTYCQANFQNSRGYCVNNACLCGIELPPPLPPPTRSPVPNPPSPSPSPSSLPVRPPLAQARFVDDQLGRYIEVSYPVTTCPTTDSDWDNVQVYDYSSTLVLLGKMSNFTVLKSQTTQPFSCDPDPSVSTGKKIKLRFASRPNNQGSFQSFKNSFAQKNRFPTKLGFDVPGKALTSTPMPFFTPCSTTAQCLAQNWEKCYSPPSTSQRVCVVRSDLDYSGSIDQVDYSILAQFFFRSVASTNRADINDSGFVDLVDYSFLAKDFDLGVPSSAR